MIFLWKAKEVLHEGMREMDYIPVSTLWICTDEITGENRAGRAYCKLFSDCIYFHDLWELLLKADEKFDEAGHPQAFQQSGSFRKKKPYGAAVYSPRLYLTDEEIRDKRGNISTACVIVKSRRRSGWQGIYIDSRGRPVNFISEMELLRCMSMQTSL